MDSAKEKDGTQVQKFVGKYEQVSTYVSWKIPLQQNYKRQKEKCSLNEVFDC